MSAKETTSPAQRINLSLALGPNPPWTNEYFDCKCGARYQLTAADECVERLQVSDGFQSFDTPPCWTCGKVNVITLFPPIRS
jgi:hypothetical protein